MATMTATSDSQSGVVLRKIPGAALVGGLVGAIGNVILFFITQAAGVVYDIPMGGPGSPLTPLPFPAVAVATLIPAIGAGALLAIMGRFLKQPLRIFQIVALVFLVVSMIPSMTLPVPLGTRLALSAMHIVAGAAIVWGLTTRTR
jgi:Family of unknown function (DUF6069)